jgi:hypothetical protein
VDAQAHLGYPETNRIVDLLRSTRTAFHGHRTAKILIICMVFPVLLAGCQPEVGYRPPLLPIEFSVDASGAIDVKASPEIATPLGTFSLQQSLAHRKVPINQTLLIVRRPVHGVLKDYLIKIRSSVKMTFLLNGTYDFTGEDNIAVLKIHRGVSGIRIQNDDNRHSAPRLSAKRVRILPTPEPTPTPTESLTPTEPSDCLAVDAAGCPGTVDPNPGDSTTPDPATPDPATDTPLPEPSPASTV